MKSRVEKLVRPAQSLSEWEKEKYVHDFICQNVHYDKLKKAYSMRSLDLWDRALASAKALPKQSRSFSMRWESGV